MEKSEKFFRIYIAGLLPQLTYYENKHISKEERDEGKDRFRFKLRDIMDDEKAEVQEREQTAHDKEESIHLTKCFVENLDKDQLFDSLFIFDNEEQGECLLKIGGEENNLISELDLSSTKNLFNTNLLVTRMPLQIPRSNCRYHSKNLQSRSRTVWEAKPWAKDLYELRDGWEEKDSDWRTKVRIASF